MLSDVTTVAGLVQSAPALAVAVCALLFAAWSFRASRKNLERAESRLGLSAVRQGKRLGRLETGLRLLDMRRLITEEELGDVGIRLSYWPPDGRRGYARDDRDDDRDDEDTADEDQADDDGPLTEARRIPVPPLPPEVAARHRRPAP